ncbi:hypothetical protein [Pseudomonas oryzihabitans]|uniref:hypothetical protein n=1 Tax=Pseudomonas oryzihabitans TaxID=47885 RepID=UPI002894FAF9|nr:hypothetical protein [Pseudomonas oryzihabitans]MDT3717930.1 hypothetical protein [Pseudomonas oryzihabitans]
MLFHEWIVAPIKFGSEGRYISLDSKSRFSQGADSIIQSTQHKYFENIDYLVIALMGNLAATECRRKEENLALDVLANLATYEEFVVDKVIRGMKALISCNKYQSPLAGKSTYGPAAVVDWTKDIVEELKDAQPIERLYKKIAAIHDFSQVNRGNNEFLHEKRNDHRDMRINKYSLSESHVDVIAARKKGISIWAGKSGSTMDIVQVAKLVCHINEKEVAALALCIAAFFHFMPTSQSSTHTYHEVISGASTVDGGIINYLPDTPPKPPVSFVHSKDKPQHEGLRLSKL